MKEFREKYWGLEKNLFTSSPLVKEVLEEVFTGREAQLETVQSAVLDAPKRLLLSGLFGAGKTVMIKEIVRRTGDSAKVIMEHVYDSDHSLGHVILRGAAEAFCNEDEYARRIHSKFLGVDESTTTTHESQEGLLTGLPKFLEFSDRETGSEQVTRSIKKLPGDPIPVVRKLIADAEARAPTRRILIVVDDLDRRDPDHCCPN